jgi:S1-C subfamily serine protease
MMFFSALLALGGIIAGSSINAQETAIEPVVRQMIPAVARVTGYKRAAGTENEYHKYGESSGFFVDKKGIMLTVYSGYVELETRMLCEKFEVELFDNRVVHAGILAIDPPLNLVILKMAEEDEYPALDISASPEYNPGEKVWAIAGKKSDHEFPGFSGLVKAEDKTSIYEDGFGDLLIDTYMELPEYAYGGPLVNNNGEVLGLNTPYTHRDEKGEETTGEEHAVPISDIKTIYEVLLANPTFEQKWLGFSVRFLNMEEMALARQVLQRRGGIGIDFVWKEGPAGKTGIRSGDILVMINGSPILTTTHFKGTLFEIENQIEVELKIIRNGVLLSERVRVEKRPRWAAP